MEREEGVGGDEFVSDGMGMEVGCEDEVEVWDGGVSVSMSVGIEGTAGGGLEVLVGLVEVEEWEFIRGRWKSDIFRDRLRCCVISCESFGFRVRGILV